MCSISSLSNINLPPGPGSKYRSLANSDYKKKLSKSYKSGPINKTPHIDRRMSYVEQELIILPEHIRSPRCLVGFVLHDL